MGHFRKHKLSDFTAAECRSNCLALLVKMRQCFDVKKLESLAQEWAEFRELLARHEGKNQIDVV